MTDREYMQRALQLAAMGKGHVSPNPMVGCVIVHNKQIIGEGFHRKYGEGHAEVNALNSVTGRGGLLKNCTVYVTLEPCAHHGKTPPCAKLLVEKSVERVIVAHKDPFAKVDGKGINILRAAGIEVEVGLLEQQAKELNKRFITFHRRHRPYVILKWAQTADGFVAKENFESKWISNTYSRQLVHKWRADEDAILVGKNTAHQDDPALTVRDWAGKNPVRVLVDHHLDIVDSKKNLLDNTAETLIFNTKKEGREENTEWIKQDDITPRTVLDALYQRNILSLIVEGGAGTLNDFIAADCWDEARIFISDAKFEKGIKAPELTGDLMSSKTILRDRLLIYKNEHPAG